MPKSYYFQLLSQIWYVYPYLILVSTIYWYPSRSVIKSIHGVLLIAASVYTILISTQTTLTHSPSYYYYPLNGLCLLALLSVTCSFSAFKANKWWHLLHIGTLPAGLLIWFVGVMTITHDWI